MLTVTQDMANIASIALGLVAFVLLAANELQKARDETQLADVRDYLDRLETMIDDPADSPSGPSSPELREIDETLKMANDAAKKALRKSKQHFISLREELSKAGHTRDIRYRIAVGLIGTASLVQLGAFLLPRQL